MRPPYSVLARRMGPGKPKRRKNPNWIGLKTKEREGLARKILGRRHNTIIIGGQTKSVRRTS